MMCESEFACLTGSRISSRQAPSQNCRGIGKIQVLERIVASGAAKGKLNLRTTAIENFPFVDAQYSTHRSSSAVKQRIIELLFLWANEIKEPKILEAYQMLKNQGAVESDPVGILPVRMCARL